MFKPPRKREWIGCEFPGCNKWFHRECLGLSFPTRQSKESYCHFCKDHPTTNYISENKEAASDRDKQVLETDASPKCKRPWISRDNNQIKGSKQDFKSNPNYVEHNSIYYHISEFLSLQQGKAYAPATSRNARWMTVSRANYYDNIGKIAALPNQDEITANSFAAFWMKEGLITGKITQMYSSPNTKSAYPVIRCTHNDRMVTSCVEIALVDIESDTWVLNCRKRFMSCPMNSFLATLKVWLRLKL